MSDNQAGQGSRRKPSTEKNIRKLRTISAVCSLTSSWQQWATENSKKQASEPSGWAPSSLGGPAEEPKKTWVPKKAPPAQSSRSEEAKKAFVSTQDVSETDDVKSSAEPPAASRIKTKQVVKTVTSGVQEKSAGITLLTEMIRKESLPSDEDIDRLLKKKSSPTRRRKCSNMVSSLTKSWKQVENEQKVGKDGGSEERTCDVHKDNSGDTGAGKERLDKEEPQTSRINNLKEDTEGDSELGLRIKRPPVSS